MMNYPEQLSKLIESFSNLPGVGRKTAERYVFYLLKRPKEELQRFADNLIDMKTNNFLCSDCFNFSASHGLCPICSNAQRESEIICVVEDIQDLNNIEASGGYRGMYHVLGGKIDPIEGLTPEMLKVKELVERVQKKSIKEIILALNPDMAGESTMLYLKKILLPLNIKITLLARGLPMGGDIEYADEITLANALRGRLEIK